MDYALELHPLKLMNMLGLYETILQRVLFLKESNFDNGHWFIEIPGQTLKFSKNLGEKNKIKIIKIEGIFYLL